MAEHKRFLGLCEELEALTEELGKAIRYETTQPVEKTTALYRPLQ